MSLMQQDRERARKKGLIAGAATAGSVLLLASGAPIILSVAGVVGSAYLVRDWFLFRAKRGMRF